MEEEGEGEVGEEAGEVEVVEGDGVALVGEVVEVMVEEDMMEVVEVMVEEAMMEVVEVTVEVTVEVEEEGGHPEEAEGEVSTTPGLARDTSRGTTGTSTTSTDRTTFMTTVVVEVVGARGISTLPCWRILGPSWRSITGMEMEVEPVEGTLRSPSLERRRTPRYLRLRRTRCLNL